MSQTLERIRWNIRDLEYLAQNPGQKNERCDRESKLQLDSLQGGQECWIVDEFDRKVEIYRRRGHPRLNLVTTLFGDNEITSPLLPEFHCSIECFFAQ